MKEAVGWSIGIIVTPLSPSLNQDTRASLLLRLKDWGNEGSWQDFYDTYWRLIYHVGIKAGLTDAEAQDTVQETILAVAKNIKGFQYDPGRCSFKSWLLLITRQRIIWQLRRRSPQSPRGNQRNAETSRTASIERIPDPNGVDLAEVWDLEWQKNLMTAAIDRVKEHVRPRQFQIFDLYVLQNWPARDVSRTLKVSFAQIYVAKHRVSASLKKEVEKLQNELNGAAAIPRFHPRT